MLKSHLNGGGILASARQTKTAGRRRVALVSEAVTVLRRHDTEQRRQREIGGSDWPENGLVFDRGDGYSVSPHTVERVMARTVRRLGLTPALTPHGLRHTFASTLARQEVPLTVIQGLLGHPSYTTTADFYVHHGPMDERSAIAAFAALLRGDEHQASDSTPIRVHHVSSDESAS